MFESRPRLRLFIAAVAAIGWLALGLQLYLSIRLSIANGKGAANGVAAFLGYFTILTNLLAAVALTAPLVAPRSSLGRFFSRASVISGVAASIAVVGIVYSLLLRHIWNPQGLQLVADHLLHDAMPLLFLVYWWLAVPSGSIAWANIPSWCVYPIAYLMYALVRGALTAWYPYPFVDVSTLGYGRTFVNAIGILVGFSVVAAALVLLTRLKKPVPVPATSRG